MSDFDDDEAGLNSLRLLEIGGETLCGATVQNEKFELVGEVHNVKEGDRSV